MINKIVDGISKAINEEFGKESDNDFDMGSLFKIDEDKLQNAFGKDYEIYTDGVEQGLQEPCFSIVSVKPTNNLFRPNKYFRQYPFCIHYFPSSNEKRTECQKVMEKLYLILEYIEIEEVYDDVKTKSKTMGTKMNAEIDNGVLHFFVNYDMYVNKLEEKTPMDSYDYNTDVRKG
mgnify:CR=1 FL=1